ncbi:hypothetical protein Ahy_A07g036087 [Arachis hypogaea]|uniref:Uncharacterized protein n=1 Tax=Arachis hypogaea TaxID=3818 RepID=A0A445CF78_ARAHY|nr:hypothetical protein Ahy_A07g036087 [Arachis hypogaea]
MVYIGTISVNFQFLWDVDEHLVLKVVLHHLRLCYPNQAEMLKQHMQLSMSNNEKARSRPSKTYQLFVAVVEGHHELSFIEKDVRNYITREVRNVSELDDAKEFGKYLLRMKEKNQNFFFELELEVDQSIKIAFWADARSRVNHHGQSILLGYSLMKNEDIQSFKWLFEC